MSNTVPQIRFNGYSDDWVQRNLSELLQERNQQIEPNEEYKLMSFVAGTGVTPKGERYDRSALVTNDSKKYKVTEFGDFIYSSNNLETGSIGFNRTGKAVISPVYSIFYSTENADSRFIGLLSSQKKFIHSMVRYRQGVVYGQWRIHESDFLKIAVSTPKLDEQDKIIYFFERFDNLIAANQRKLDLLKEQKKGYLQKMFPKNGAKVPELRFAGFANDWEERKLGEIFDTITDYVANGSFESLRKNVNSSDINGFAYLVRLQDASNNWKGPWLYTDQHGYEFLKKSRLQPDDIIMANVGSVGKFFLVPNLDKPMTLAPNAVLIKSSENDQGFLYQMMLTPEMQYKIFEKTTPGAQSKINKTDFKMIETRLPNIEEQKKIGSFFKQLDDTIALHQRKLELLKEQKNGFLQRMFV